MSAGTFSVSEHPRLITGVALSLAIVTVVFFLDRVWMGLVFALAAMLAAWEWSNLLAARRPFFLGIVALLLALWFFRFFGAVPILDFFLYAAVVWWAGVFFLIAAHRPAWHETTWLRRYFSVGGILVLSGAWLAITRLDAVDLFYLLLLVSASDIAAYYVGRRWGKRKLVPELSPGKSVAGLYAGLVCAALVALLGGLSMEESWLGILDLALVSLFTVMVGVVGDLGCSMLKRIARRKDSGRLLPGHGGVLDRADSTLAAAPVFLFIMPS